MTATATANGIELAYETFGVPADPALLLVMGLGAQMISWPDEFCRMLAEAGHHVVRFDNRDIGLSSGFDDQPVDLIAVMTAAVTGQEVPPVPYRLTDMAADAVGLLDALGIPDAHVVGASMGGMIVQTMAIEHPQRVRSMTSIMSTSGERDLPQAAPEVAAVLTRPPATARAEAIDAAVAAGRLIGGTRFFDEARSRELAAAQFDRSYRPMGMARQLAAIVASGNRAAGLRTVSAPTLVIHGCEDTLIPLAGGQRTAELVPRADLLLVSDMGHDLPEPLWPLLVGAIAGHIRRADALPR